MTAEDRDTRRPSKKSRNFRKKKVRYPQHDSEGVSVGRSERGEKYRKYQFEDEEEEDDV